MLSPDILLYSPKNKRRLPMPNFSPKNSPEIQEILNQAVGRSFFETAKELDVEVLEILQAYGSAPTISSHNEDISSLNVRQKNNSSSDAVTSTSKNQKLISQYQSNTQSLPSNTIDNAPKSRSRGRSSSSIQDHAPLYTVKPN